MQETLTVIAQVGILTFVVAGMAALGLSLKSSDIVAPLRNIKLVVLVIVANFVLVPAIAILAAKTLPMEPAASAAVILIGCCAGAPFLPTLAKLAKGDAALSVGVMVLLMVLTVVFAPIVVPLAIDGAQVSTWGIAQSLVFTMLLPLALGLIVNARYPDVATAFGGGLSRASSTGLAIGIVAGLFVTWREVLGAVGSWIFVGAAVVIIAGILAGWLAGLGRTSSDRDVLGLGTAQRNIAAALVIAPSLGHDVVVSTLVAALVLPIVLISLAAEIGRRRARQQAAAAQSGGQER